MNTLKVEATAMNYFLIERIKSQMYLFLSRALGRLLEAYTPILYAYC